ncbi:MAG: large subunit ribosomal protein [Solirubrobacterales bacterium]|jgi:large subunit ribosomal protein L24|nr:large subunit ribosomal protein [Solirubrobacterales bacterium]MDX6653078.1 large subunit ribosomal protein [Solirubrobacterales bacterium]MDX6663768.1 large subunit ribosomal protein [Solirubrobacterales bacterium]
MAGSMKIRKGDDVILIGGKDRGKQGRVIRTEPKRDRVYVEGLNMVTRHQRAQAVKDTQKGGEIGGRIKKEGPIHVSNVALLDPKANKPTRVGVTREGGQRKRVAKRSGAAID